MPTQTSTLLNQIKHDLKDAGIPSYALDANLILCNALNISREELLLKYDDNISDEHKNLVIELANRRRNREPISHIIGYKEFWGREFCVNNNTLTPRPDSETLIESILHIISDHNKPLKILDLGTGTGCLLLTLLLEYPNSWGLGVDISQSALDIARKNSYTYEVADRVEFIISDWGNSLSSNFDLIISNPPYIKQQNIKNLEPEVAVFEPILALSGGEDGFDCYRIIAANAYSLLSNDGLLILEIGIGQEEEVTKIMSNSRLVFRSAHNDLSGIVRCLVFSL